MLRFGRIPRKGERWKGRFADFVIEDATPTGIRKIRMILAGEEEGSGRMNAANSHPDPRRRHRARGLGRRRLDPRGGGRSHRLGRSGRRPRSGEGGGRSPSAEGHRVRAPEPHRAQGTGRHADRQGLRLDQRPPPQDARPLRQPAPRAEPALDREPVHRRRHGHRPREHRGALQRPRAHGPAGRRAVAQDHHRRGVDAHREVRLRVRPPPRPQAASPPSTRRTS